MHTLPTTPKCVPGITAGLLTLGAHSPAMAATQAPGRPGLHSTASGAPRWRGTQLGMSPPTASSFLEETLSYKQLLQNSQPLPTGKPAATATGPKEGDSTRTAFPPRNQGRETQRLSPNPSSEGERTWAQTPELPATGPLTEARALAIALRKTRDAAALPPRPRADRKEEKGGKKEAAEEPGHVRGAARRGED